MDNDTWHELRKKNIGGSEIAALFGECPYSTYYQLWHEKKELLSYKNLDDIERVTAGNFLESAVIEWANYKWGFDFYRPECYVEHATVEGMGCTPDAYSKKHKKRIAQVKNVDSLQFAKKWEHDGEIITEAPLYILLQLQHEMECTQADENYLIVLVGGNRLFYMVCKKDLEIGAILRNKVSEFWAREEAPEPDFKKDIKSIKEIRNSLRLPKQDDYSKDKNYLKLLKQANKLKHEIKTRQDKLSVAEAEIYHLSLDNEEIRCKDFLVKFSKRKDGVTMLKIIDEGIKL